jgi:beta-xylosidase
MDQGSTPVNGPHQGAWVNTVTGEDWFLHFQDKKAYGRVVHLQPMTWVDDWPVIGVDKDGDGKGEPVLTYKKPNVGKTYPVQTPAESDEFNDIKLGLQWQWHANPQATWLFTSNAGYLRLYSQKVPDSSKNYWDVPNLLLQKLPAEEFTATTKLKFTHNQKLEGEKAGFIVMGQSYAYLALNSTKSGISLIYTTCHNAAGGKAESEKIITPLKDREIYLQLKMTSEAKCKFAYSTDGKNFTAIENEFQAEMGRWIGAKMGFFCTRTTQTNDSGYVDVDWFRLTK